MAASTSGIDQLRQMINTHQELIRAFLASDQNTAMGLLVSWGKAHGVSVTVQEIENAIKAKGTSSSAGHPVVLAHSLASAHTSPF
jgi:hypothetical protein